MSALKSRASGMASLDRRRRQLDGAGSRVDLDVGADRQGPLRRLVADHRAEPGRNPKRLDVIREYFFQRQRGEALTGPTLCAGTEDESADPVEDPGELQLREHPVDAVKVLANIFDE